MEDIKRVFDFLNKIGEPAERKSVKVMNNHLEFMRKYGRELHKFNPENVLFHGEEDN